MRSTLLRTKYHRTKFDFHSSPDPELGPFRTGERRVIVEEWQAATDGWPLEDPVSL
jgi:hypothetical protein